MACCDLVRMRHAGGFEPPPRVLPSGATSERNHPFFRRCDDEMVYIDCGCDRSVLDEWHGRSRPQSVRLLCPPQDQVLQASQGEVLQGTEGEMLQEPLWLRLRKQLWKRLW